MPADEHTYNLMTTSQEIIVAALTVLGGSLSLLGSTTIIYNIISKKKFKRDSYHRLLLGTCAFDVISSIGWITHTFAAPKDTSSRFLSIGNVASCTASGFLIQWSISYMIYNACLAIYFLVTIRYNLSAARVVRMETIMHSISVVWGLGCAVVPIPLELYNENAIGPGCWLNEYPNDCSESPDVECIRGLVNSEYVGYAIGAFPVAVCLLAVLVSNSLVYISVRSKELATQKMARRLSQTFNNTTEQPTNKRTKAIATQASWYVAVFVNSAFWQLLFRILGLFYVINPENESQWVSLIALAQFFSSSAGFGFLLVFVRPRYLRFRERDQLTRRGAFVAALSFDNNNRNKRPRPPGSSISLRKDGPRSSNPRNGAYLDDSSASTSDNKTQFGSSILA